jgi:hypothetical protein
LTRVFYEFCVGYLEFFPPNAVEKGKNSTHSFPHPVERKMTDFGKIPKISDKINGFPPSIVENYVDIVDKTPYVFPQRCVENESDG